jgi:hypothetical protein
VAVEAAIVMPLHVFLMLGLIQLFLMFQAHLMTKYASYRAVRAGAMKNALTSEMEKAALVALMPMVAERFSSMDVVKPTMSPAAASAKWARLKDNEMLEDDKVKHVEVMICGPVRRDMSSVRNGEVDFDDPRLASAPVGSESTPNWRAAQMTKLRIQLTFNYRMPIPFANWVFYRIARGMTVAQMLRMGPGGLTVVDDPYSLLASKRVYVMPLRRNYTMRMQSNIFVNEAPLPEENECIIPFPKFEESVP